jgi:hypothetical protein
MTVAHRPRRARCSCVSTGAPPRESGRRGNDRGHASAALTTRRATRKRDLLLLAVMNSDLAQCTPWHRGTNYDSASIGSFCDAVRPSVSQRRGQPCRQPCRGGRWPMSVARTLLCWRRSAVRVRERWTGSWVQTYGTQWRAAPHACVACPPINDHSGLGVVIQPSSIQRRWSLFTGSANGTLLADSAEISAVWDAKQAVLPQRQPSGQQRPSPQHFHPLEQQVLSQQSPPLSQMLERQQMRRSRSMHRETPLILQQDQPLRHVVPPQPSPPPPPSFLGRQRPLRHLILWQHSRSREQRPQNRVQADLASSDSRLVSRLATPPTARVRRA